MKIIHGQGFNQEDQLMYRRIIKKNVISSMQNMVSAMDMLFIRYENEVSHKMQAVSFISLNLQYTHWELSSNFKN